MIFSIEEFSVYDGPGIRTSVFFAGCPLRCNWCHNPECFFVSEAVDAATIAKQVMKNANILSASGGGATFTGGEPLAQPDFLFELLDLTKPLHRSIETSGYAAPEIFERAVNSCDLVLMDLKLIDPDKHKKYTGVCNSLILSNFNKLKHGKTPFIVRMPLIPGVNDDEANLTATAELINGSKNLIGVELLPYNRAAGAKYAKMGLDYAPLFDESAPINIRTDIFEKRSMPCSVL